MLAEKRLKMRAIVEEDLNQKFVQRIVVLAKDQGQPIDRYLSSDRRSELIKSPVLRSVGAQMLQQ